jgi:hypothetical protein
MMCARLVLLTIAVAAGSTFSVSLAHAQRVTADTLPFGARQLPVQTFALKHLDVKDAARLVAPYLQSPASGAFEAASGLGVITIRGTLQELERAKELLAEFDRAPRSVRLRFQIIEPVQEANQDPRIREVTGALRELFAAPGYRLLGEALVTTDEFRRFHVTVSAGQTALYVNGLAQRSEHADAGVRLQVALHQNQSDESKPGIAPLFSGSLTAVMGQVVVLGSAVPLMFGDTTAAAASSDLRGKSFGARTIILTVQPQLLGTP